MYIFEVCLVTEAESALLAWWKHRLPFSSLQLYARHSGNMPGSCTAGQHRARVLRDGTCLYSVGLGLLLNCEVGPADAACRPSHDTRLGLCLLVDDQAGGVLDIHARAKWPVQVSGRPMESHKSPDILVFHDEIHDARRAQDEWQAAGGSLEDFHEGAAACVRCRSERVREGQRGPERAKGCEASAYQESRSDPPSWSSRRWWPQSARPSTS